MTVLTANMFLISVWFCCCFVYTKGQLILQPDTDDDVQLQKKVFFDVTVKTTQCYTSMQRFMFQYIEEAQSKVVYEVGTYDGSSGITGSGCSSGTSRYAVTINLKFIDKPELVGMSFNLKVTNINNTMTVISRRTFTFPAPLDLTGSSEYAILNTAFTWTCTVPPSTRFIDWYRNKNKVGLVYVHDNGTCMKANVDEKYQYSCGQDSYTLTLPASVVTGNEQNTLWRCQDSTGGVETGSRYQKLNISIPVTNVTISPGSGSTVTFNENVEATFTCTTNAANPPAVIQWFLDSTDITTLAGPNTKDITLTVNRTHHQKHIKCTAMNGANTDPLEDSTQLNIIYPPAADQSLVILGYNNGQILYESSVLNITCQQPGGNPVVNMTFTCISETGVSENTGSVAVRRIVMNVNRSMNNKNCVCESSHIENYKQQTTINLIVYYPPSAPNITLGKSFPWKAKDNASLSCRATAGNPPNTTYKWMVNDITMVTSTSSVYIIHDLKSVDNGKDVSCKVDNQFTIHERVDFVSQKMTLEVEYDPVVTLGPLTAEVIEGKNKTLMCSATGNPVPHVAWYKHSVPLTTSTILSSSYHIVNVSRSQSGNYVCRANSTSTGSNTMYPDEKQLLLTVLYPPTVSLYVNNATERDPNHTITCNAIGIPNNSTITSVIQKIGGSEIRDLTTDTRHNNLKTGLWSFTIDSVSYEDIGTYVCKAQNGIADRSNDLVQSGHTFFDVQASAKFEKKILTFYSELRHPVSMVIPFYSNPPASLDHIKWSVRNMSLQTSDYFTFSLEDHSVTLPFYGKNVTVDGQMAVLNISEFLEDHKGHYTLTITNTNSLVADVTVLLIPSGQPETPVQFKTVAFMTNSITLSWIAKSNRGHPQTFVILYKIQGSTVYKNVTVDGTDKLPNSKVTFEVTGLNDGTTYEFQLFASNVKGRSLNSSSEPLIAKTESPKMPLDVTVQCKDNVAIISWASEENGGDVHEFEVLYKKEDDNNFINHHEQHTYIEQGHIFSATITDLIPMIIYNFKVIPKNVHSPFEAMEAKNCFIADTASCSCINVTGIIGGTSTALFVITIIILTVVIRKHGRCLIKGLKTDDDRYEDVSSPQDIQLAVNPKPAQLNQQNRDTGSLYEKLQHSRDQHTYDDLGARHTYTNLELH